VIKVSVANTGSDEGYSHGTPVCVHVPVDALRVLASTGAAPAAGHPDGPDPSAALPAGASS
jgi:hypothetical protein